MQVGSKENHIFWGAPILAHTQVRVCVCSLCGRDKVSQTSSQLRIKSRPLLGYRVLRFGTQTPSKQAQLVAGQREKKHNTVHVQTANDRSGWIIRLHRALSSCVVCDAASRLSVDSFSFAQLGFTANKVAQISDQTSPQLNSPTRRHPIGTLKPKESLTGAGE